MSLLARPFILLPRAARHRAFWLGLPLLLYSWTVTGPFLFDDLHLVLKAERFSRGEAPRLDLFRFAKTEKAWQSLRDQGTFPWWAPDNQRIDLFRPVAEWSFYLDTRLFGRSPVGHRLVSLAWFALALICIHRLYMTVGGDRGHAGAAAFFVGISQTATQPVTFVSNRSDLLVLVGTALAAGFYWRAARGLWLRPRSAGRGFKSAVPPVILAAVTFVFALLSKETAVALAGVLIAHEALAYWRRRVSSAESAAPAADRAATDGQRMAVACACLVIAAAYLTYYALTRPWHLGLPGTSVSQDSFFLRAPVSLMLYLAVWTTGFPINALIHGSAGHLAIVATCGLLGACVVGKYLGRTIRDGSAPPGTPFFILWSVILLLPALMTHPEARVLCPATVGWAYVLAALLIPARQAADRQGRLQGTDDDLARVARPTPLWLRHWLFAANGAVSIGCAIGTILISVNAEGEARALLDQYRSAQHDALEEGDVLIIAEARTPLEFICAGDRLRFLTGTEDIAIAFLTSPGANADIQRENDRTLLLTAREGSPLLATSFHRRMLGTDWKPSVGDTFRRRHFTAEIAAVAGDDSVTALRFIFNQPLSSRRLHLYPPALDAVARGETATTMPGAPTP